jgi:cytochrome c oxidase subunit 1
MTDATFESGIGRVHNSHSAIIKLTMGLGGVVFLLMMVVGLLMRMSQSGFIELDPALFYQFLTAHGAGMVGSAALSGAAIMWYFVARHVALNPVIFRLFLVLFLTGVVCILGSIFIGQYGGTWTFLFPLPAQSGGAWEAGAAVTFCVGYMLIGVSFLIHHFEIGYKIAKSHGGLLGGLGWRWATNGQTSPAPAPAVVAASNVVIFNSMGIVFGAAVLVATIVNLLFPEFAVDALLAKNATYFFGHVFVNATVYMAVIAVYEIIPDYTGKPWKTTRLFVFAWAAVLVFVQIVYFHHLLQDVNMPKWAMAIGQIISYASGIPLIAVTLFSTATYIKGSKMTWDLPTRLLVLGVGGWAVGAIPAMIDGMIAVNRLMHNTLWVPGHFHTYLLLGEVAMAFGFSAWLVKDRAQAGQSALDRFAFGAYAMGGAGFVLMFLWSGASSIPRRWAVHYPEWQFQDKIASAFAVVVVLATCVFVLKYISGLLRQDPSR